MECASSPQMSNGTSTPRVSLIVATLGRYEEIGLFLASLAGQTSPATTFEVIVIDQNDTLDLRPILSVYDARLSIEHVRSAKKGLSVSRNIGLDIARGEIVAFPDDDCIYYPDTLESVCTYFDTYRDNAVILGAIYDRASQTPLIRRWPSEARRVSKWNFYLLLSSITIFSKAREVRFDERLGAGAKFGSNEDADYVYRVLDSGLVARYEPSIQVWHKAMPTSQSSPARVSRYGAGFGAFVAKNMSLTCFVLFLQAVSYHFAVAAKAICALNPGRARVHVIASLSRIAGAFRFGLLRVLKHASGGGAGN